MSGFGVGEDAAKDDSSEISLDGFPADKADRKENQSKSEIPQL